MHISERRRDDRYNSGSKLLIDQKRSAGKILPRRIKYTDVCVFFTCSFYNPPSSQGRCPIVLLRIHSSQTLYYSACNSLRSFSRSDCWKNFFFRRCCLRRTRMARGQLANRLVSENLVLCFKLKPWSRFDDKEFFINV